MVDGPAGAGKPDVAGRQVENVGRLGARRRSDGRHGNGQRAERGEVRGRVAALELERTPDLKRRSGGVGVGPDENGCVHVDTPLSGIETQGSRADRSENLFRTVSPARDAAREGDETPLDFRRDRGSRISEARGFADHTPDEHARELVLDVQLHAHRVVCCAETERDASQHGCAVGDHSNVRHPHAHVISEKLG